MCNTVSYRCVSCFCHRIVVQMLLVVLSWCWTPAVSIAQQSSPTSTESPVPYSVEVRKDIIYAIRPPQAEWPEAQFMLDIYAPTEPGTWPVVVFMHGSGETKDLWPYLMRALAEQGVIAVSINYHGMTPRDAITNDGRGFREMAETAACAIRFARKKALDYGGKATQMSLVGFSMGGGLAAYMALGEDEITHQWEEFAASKGGPPQQVTCEVNEGELHVDALVGIAGAYDAFVGYNGKWGGDWLQANDPDLWKMFSSAIGKNLDMKIRLLHGAHDSTIPFENSSAFEAILSDAGYDVELIQFDGGHLVRVELTVNTVMDVIRDYPGHEEER